MTTKHHVIKCHRDHPDWSSGRIAASLGCGPEYVRATLKRAGLKLIRRNGEHGRIADIRVAAVLSAQR